MSTRAPTNAPRILAVVGGGVVLAGLYALAAQSRYPGGGDAPYHILTARSWFGGGGFIPGDPTQTKYPPAWSLALGAAGLFMGNSYAALARFTAALFPVLLFATWLFVRRHSGVMRANWITVAVALSPACFDAATRGARSEVLFTAASMAFLAWHARASTSDRRGASAFFAGVVLMVATVMLRTIGVALLLAVIATIVHVAIFERPRLRALAATSTAPVLFAAAALFAWKLLSRSSAVERYPGERMNLYGSQFRLIDPHRPSLGVADNVDVLARIPGNLKSLIGHSAEMLTNIQWISPVWTSPVVMGLLVVLVAGVISELRRPAPLPAYYLLGYVGILTIWPFDEGQRFLVPIAPLLFLFAASGMAFLSRVAHSRTSLVTRCVIGIAVAELAALAVQIARDPVLSRQGVFALFVWLVVLVIAIIGRRHLAAIWTMATRARLTRFAYRTEFIVLGFSGIYALAVASWKADKGIGNGFQVASRWIAEHTGTDAVVMAQRHLDFALTTGRRCVVFPVIGDPVRLVTALQRTGTRYLVVYDTPIELAYYVPLERDRFSRIQNALNGALRLRVHDQDVSVYELPPPDSLP